MHAYEPAEGAKVDPCRAGTAPHHMISHFQDGVAAWIEMCSICGTLDTSEHDEAIKAQAYQRAREVYRSAPAHAYTRWLDRQVDGASGKVVVTHMKISSFGDDTCACGFDGWPCEREREEDR